MQRTTPLVGINLSFGEVKPYANLVRQAAYVSDFNKAYAGPFGTLDANFNPQQDYALSLSNTTADIDLVGQYPIQFPGQATVYVPGNVNSSATITDYSYDDLADMSSCRLNNPNTPQSGQLYVAFTNTQFSKTSAVNSGLNLSQMTIMRPGHSPTDKWNKLLLADMVRFKGGFGRDLDLTGTNNVPNMPPQTVANRTDPRNPIQSGAGTSYGMCYEDLIDLFNTMNMGWWCVLPDTITDELFDFIGNLVKSSFKGNWIPVYGNELWNNNFQQEARMVNNANALNQTNPTLLNDDGLATSNTLQYRYHAYMALHYADRGKAIFGADQLGITHSPILDTQAANYTTIAEAVGWIERTCAARGDKITDNFAGGGGAVYRNPVKNPADPDATVDNIIASGMYPTIGLAQDMVYFKPSGLCKAAYEGGPEVGGGDFNAVAQAVKLDPRWEELCYQTLMNIARCGTMYIGLYSWIRGAWSYDPDLEVTDSPEIRALDRFLANYPPDGSTPTSPDPEAVTPPAIADGSFEQNQAPGYTPAGFVVEPSGTGWTWTSTSGINGSTTGYINAGQGILDGLQCAFLQNDGAISQVVTGFIVGQSYSLRFAACQRMGNSAPQTLTTKLDNLIVETYTPGPSADATGVQFVYHEISAFTATATRHTITITGGGLGSQSALIDDVSLLPMTTPAPITPVVPVSMPSANAVASAIDLLIRRI